MAPQKDDYYDSTVGTTAFPWSDKHAPGCYVGRWRGGLIVSVDKRQAQDYKTRKPKFWPDGKGGFSDRPIMVRIIAVHCPEERDPNNPADNGLRSHWIEDEGLKYSKNHATRPGQDRPDTRFWAYDKAMEAAGVPQTLPEPGGYFYVCQTGSVQGDGQEPRKTWVANYQRPTPQSLAELNQIVGTLGLGNDQREQAPASTGQQQGPFHVPEGVQANGNGHQPTYQPQQVTTPPPPPAPGQTSQHAPAPVNGQQQGAPVSYDPQTGAPIYAPAAAAPAAAPAAQSQITGYNPQTGEPIYATVGAASAPQHQSPPPPPRPGGSPY